MSTKRKSHWPDSGLTLAIILIIVGMMGYALVLHLFVW